MPDVLVAPALLGTEAYVGALVVAGANQATGTVKVAPPVVPGEIDVYNLVTGTNLLTRDLCYGQLLAAWSATSTLVQILTHSHMSWLFPSTGNKRLVAFMQRNGLGALNIISSIYRGSVANQAAMIALSSATVGDWCYRSDVSQRYILTTAPYSTAGNWTAVPVGIGQPPIDLGTVASQAAMLGLTLATPGDVVIRSDQSNQKYRLNAAPYSTLANWEMTSSTAGIVIDMNSLDPAGLPIGHPELTLSAIGYDQWRVT